MLINVADEVKGGVHPKLMGNTCQAVFPELWDDICCKFDTAEQTGLAVNIAEYLLSTERNGYLEETYFTGSFLPVVNMDGSTGGFYNTANEVTRQVILTRRTALLNLLTLTFHTGLKGGSLASHVMPVLETNPTDITMALLYEVDEERTPGSSYFSLRGQIGVPRDHGLAIEEGDLTSLPLSGLIPALRKARTEILTLPVDESFKGVQWCGFGEPSSNFSIIPLSQGDRLLGFLCVGLNPRRLIDEDHHQFMRDLQVRVSGVAGTLISAEESRKRSEHLEKQLLKRERQINYLAKNAAVGMQHVRLDGTMIWANDQYYNLTGHSRESEAQYKLSFLDMVLEEDRDRALATWEALTNGATNSVEVRLKRTFTPPNGIPEPAHIMALSFPYIEDGESKSIMTCLTDISSIKWAEKIEARNAADARNAKKQQEEFVDTVSHEMRNPLVSKISRLIRLNRSTLLLAPPEQSQVLR